MLCLCVFVCATHIIENVVLLAIWYGFNDTEFNFFFHIHSFILNRFISFESQCWTLSYIDSHASKKSNVSNESFNINANQKKKKKSAFFFLFVVVENSVPSRPTHKNQLSVTFSGAIIIWLQFSKLQIFGCKIVEMETLLEFWVNCMYIYECVTTQIKVEFDRTHTNQPQMKIFNGCWYE